jgi:hypothetical protein
LKQTERKIEALIRHSDIDDLSLRKMIKTKAINLGGNRLLKIFGKLNCKSGKRMKKENRVFFESQSEAASNGYRPCAHCMYADYKKWKADNL